MIMRFAPAGTTGPAPSPWPCSPPSGRRSRPRLPRRAGLVAYYMLATSRQLSTTSSDSVHVCLCISRHQPLAALPDVEADHAFRDAPDSHRDDDVPGGPCRPQMQIAIVSFSLQRSGQGRRIVSKSSEVGSRPSSRAQTARRRKREAGKQGQGGRSLQNASRYEGSQSRPRTRLPRRRTS